MMGSTQMYSLSWGDFGSSLASTVQVLRGHSELIDVTLAAGGRIFPAHKLVLSAASPLLMELLKSTGCQHPVVMLAGVTAHDLEALLQFLYYGEVSIDPNQLPSLLQAAHCLDIQALSPTTLTSEKMMCQSMTVGSSDGLSREDNSLLPVRKRKRKQRRSCETAVPNKWPHMESVDTDNVENMTAPAAPLTDYKEESSSCTDDSLIPLKKLVSDHPVECSICGVVLKQSRNLRRHMALIHMKPTEGRVRKTKKQTEKIIKEGTVDASSETENSVSSNSTSLLKSVSPVTPFDSVGILPGNVYQESSPLRVMIMPDVSQTQVETQSTPQLSSPLIRVTQSQEQAHIITEPSTSTSLCDTSPTFGPTSMQHAMHFTSDSLFRQHPNDMIRSPAHYNVTDTREHCAND